MSRARYMTYFLSLVVLAAMSLTFGGCKAQQQMQQQLTEMDGRVQTAERRVNTLENSQRKLESDLGSMRALVEKMGNAVVALEKVEEERARQQAEARSKAEAAAKAKPGKGAKKPVPAKGKKKK